MATKNNFTYFEDVRVSMSRKKLSFKVDLELEGFSFYVSKAIVDEIATKNKEDENLVAIILAYIEYARKSRNADNNCKAKKLEDELLISGVSRLLQEYPIERVIEIMGLLKWHEICKILASNNPVEEVEEVI